MQKCPSTGILITTLIYLLIKSCVYKCIHTHVDIQVTKFEIAYSFILMIQLIFHGKHCKYNCI